MESNGGLEVGLIAPCGGWKATHMSEMGGLGVVLNALWRMGSNRLESDGGTGGGCRRPVGVGRQQL
jgi:hypothetical protein